MFELNERRIDKKAMCPWCEKQTTPKISMIEKGHCKIREIRCAECGKVLAAYLADEGAFMRSIRKYEN